jgi:hypothetical protein
VRDVGGKQEGILMEKTRENRVRETLRVALGGWVGQTLILSLRERSLWPAALLVSLGLSESWRTLYGWDPLWLGERVAGKVDGAAGFLLGALAFLLSLLFLRALGIWGEMLLVGQASSLPVITGPREGFRLTSRRFFPLILAYLPYELLRAGVVYFPSWFIYSWGQWDPRLRLWPLYLLFVGGWGSLLLLVYGPAAALARLAAREAVLKKAEPVSAWREGWGKARRSPGRCVAAWLWSLLADAFFLIPAWLLAAVIPWLGRILGDAVPVIRWLPFLVFHLALAAALIYGQVVVQAYKSVLWTRTWWELEGREVTGPPLISVRKGKAAG